mgnify:CR=1 FL=1
MASGSRRRISRDRVRERGVLVWGADAEGGGPYVYPREDDPTRVQGFEVELADALAAKLDRQFKVPTPELQVLEQLERGEIDVQQALARLEPADDD